MKSTFNFPMIALLASILCISISPLTSMADGDMGECRDTCKDLWCDCIVPECVKEGELIDECPCERLDNFDECSEICEDVGAEDYDGFDTYFGTCPSPIPTPAPAPLTGDQRCSETTPSMYEEFFYGTWQLRPLPGGTKCCPSVVLANRITLAFPNQPCS